MAVTTALNVIAASANADVIAGRSLAICGIKVVETGGAVAHVRVRQGTVSGTVVFESKVPSGGVDYGDVALKGYADLYIEIVTGALNIYFYSE